MRYISGLCIISLVTMCATFASAQHCAEGLTVYELECRYSTTCRQTVDINLPEGGGYGPDNIACTSLSCCGQLITTCYVNGPCQNALRAGVTPELRKYLSHISLDSEFLLASCNGHYELFKRPSPASEIHNLAILDDRVLR